MNLFFNHPVLRVGDFLCFLFQVEWKDIIGWAPKIRSSDMAQERLRYGLYVQTGRKYKLNKSLSDVWENFYYNLPVFIPSFIQS
jgi:hypothetical protein